MKTDNELIAEFMGMRVEKLNIPSGKDWYRGFCFYPEYRTIKEWSCGASTKEGVEDLLASFKHQYDTSWDWLMPVVEKIETGLSWKYCVRTLIDLYSVTPLYETSVYDAGDALLLELPSEKTRILSVYKAIVEFIKWYNQQSNG